MAVSDLERLRPRQEKSYEVLYRLSRNQVRTVIREKVVATMLPTARIEAPNRRVSTITTVSADDEFYSIPYRSTQGQTDRETLYAIGIEVMRDEFGLDLLQGHVDRDEAISDDGTCVRVETFPSFKEDFSFRKTTEYNGDDVYRYTWEAIQKIEEPSVILSPPVPSPFVDPYKEIWLVE